MSIITYDASTGLELTDKPENLDTLAILIKDAADHTVRSAANATEGALIVGKMLIQAKAQVKHGEWDTWVTENCSMAIRTASAYMRLAKSVPQLEDSNRQRVTDLPLREAMRAIATDPTAPPKSTYTSIRAAKRTDADKAVAAFQRAVTALNASKKLIGLTLTVKGRQVADLRKKLNDVLAELDSLEAQAAEGGAA